MANLTFQYSAMNSGKTSNIIQTAYNYEENGFKPIIIKASKDTKGNGSIVSRANSSRKVDILLNDESLLDKKYYDLYKEANIILVDEVQFLETNHITELWVIAHLLNIPVITYGLRSNIKGEIFSEGIAKLIGLADSLQEMGSISLCSCGQKATFNARKKDGIYSDEGEIVVIDGTLNYEYVPLCGDCYIKNVKNTIPEVQRVRKLINEE